MYSSNAVCSASSSACFSSSVTISTRICSEKFFSATVLFWAVFRDDLCRRHKSTGFVPFCFRQVEGTTATAQLEKMTRGGHGNFFTLKGSN